MTTPTRPPDAADPRPIEELIRECLQTAAPETRLWWGSIEALRARGGREVLDAALCLYARPEPRARALGLDVLNQFGGPERPYRDEILPVLLRGLDDEDAAVRQAAASALAFEGGPQVVAALAARRGDPDDDVRYAVAFALGQRPDDPVAIEALVALARDGAAAVREWATFGLGSLSVTTTPVVVEALVERLGDPDPRTREEAIAGLERRKGDDCVIVGLVEALGSRPAGRGALEAAIRIADARLLPALLRGNACSDAETLLLEHAIHACSGEELDEERLDATDVTPEP
jgi:HEAT repeat protein